MNIFSFLLVLMCTINAAQAQYAYEPSDDNPYGSANPEAPKQIKDFEPMIGFSKCKSSSRNPDGSWNEPINMEWTFKYIMNGHGIQDETLKEDGKHSGSIRQFIADSSRWYVHYYSSSAPSTSLPVWEGNKEEGAIILFRDQKAPNGMEGDYRLTFYDFDGNGFKWKGEWVDKKRTIVYPTWKIECTKVD